jgi:hypothetical protein
MNKLFSHSVYFWLKPDITIADKINFEKGAKTLLSTRGLLFGHIGIAANTRRDVIESTYHYNLLLVFKDQEAHDDYQTIDETHQKFIVNCRKYWEKIKIYDSIQID